MSKKETEVEATESKATESEALVKVDREKYTESRTASGTKSLNNGDVVAVALTGVTMEELHQIADDFIEGNDFATRYANLNVGMQRMNIGNRIRGQVTKIDKANEKDNADRVKAEKPEKVHKTGAEQLEKIAKPFMKEAIARAKEAQKEADAKAKAAEAKKAEKDAKPAKKAGKAA